MDNKTNLKYWFPVIKAAGLPVPETTIVEMPLDVQQDFWEVFDGKEPTQKVLEWTEQLSAASLPFGDHFFLRSAFTSAKHEWANTCDVKDRSQLLKHVFAIAYFCECNSFMGELEWSTWVIREFLPIKPVAFCPGFDDMPVNREFRVFVSGEKVNCFHPYWPRNALEQGRAQITDAQFQELSHLMEGEEADTVLSIASAAGKVLGGNWSVDILETSNGWYLTDMAEAEKSFHWEGCANANG